MTYATLISYVVEYMPDVPRPKARIAPSFAPLGSGLLACVMSIGVVYPASAQRDNAGTLLIEIAGLESDEGQVRIAVFDAEERWLKTSVYARIVEVEDRTCAWSIEEIPYGEYGVAVFHDENGNGENDTNFMGIPKEPYGFSNNARRKFGPAKWDKAKFVVAAPTAEIEIEVK